MKRIGNLFNRIISYENLVRAEKKARLGKTKRYGVKKFDRNPHENLVRLQKALKDYRQKLLSSYGIKESTR